MFLRHIFQEVDFILVIFYLHAKCPIWVGGPLSKSSCIKLCLFFPVSLSILPRVLCTYMWRFLLSWLALSLELDLLKEMTGCLNLLWDPRSLATSADFKELAHFFAVGFSWVYSQTFSATSVGYFQKGFCFWAPTILEDLIPILQT